jgi:protein-S-isoprenylcysteine O-methyltransferase Ste14
VSPFTALSVACWVVLEVGLRVREAVHGKGRREHDRGTRTLVAISIGVAIFVAVAAGSQDPAPAWQVAGGIVLWLGLVMRIWAVAALGRSFRTTVEVDPDQAVVTGGPYRWVRHPAYLGLVLIVAGFGLALGSWLSFAAGLLIPLPALVRRIAVEEAELERVLGDAYRSYEAGRARLLPGVW